MSHQPRASQRRCRAAGFTLLELLVSMTVVSLLATTILFGWRIAASSWGRVNEIVDEQRRIDAIHRVLEEQIAEMVPVSPWLQQGGNMNMFFQGERETARFVSRYSLLHRGRSGLYRIEYHIDAGESGSKRLLMNEVPVRNVDEPGSLLANIEQGSEGTLLRFAPFVQAAETRVLLDGLSDCYFEYYRRTRPPEEAGWVTQWMNRGSELPRAMAIRVVPSSETPSLQPVSIVAATANDPRLP